MTDEELSELAEALQNACDVWIARGGRIGWKQGDKKCRCPFGAMRVKGDRFPSVKTVSRSLKIDRSVARAFTLGFDVGGGWTEGCGSIQGFDLGKQFRAQYAEAPSNG